MNRNDMGLSSELLTVSHLASSVGPSYAGGGARKLPNEVQLTQS